MLAIMIGHVMDLNLIEFLIFFQVSWIRDVIEYLVSVWNTKFWTN
jgi:hypothetical protein